MAYNIDRIVSVHIDQILSNNGGHSEKNVIGSLRTIEEIRESLFMGRYELTRHALKRVIERNISDLEIREAGGNGEPIENYPEDKYAPSCLLFGHTKSGRPLHIHVSLGDFELVRIITLYQPKDKDWIGYSIRRQ